MPNHDVNFLNYTLLGLDAADEYEEPEALSSDPISSPYATSDAAEGPDFLFGNLEYLTEDETDMDDDYIDQPRTPVNRGRRV